MKKALLIFAGLGVLGYGIYRYLKVQGKLLSDFDWKISGVQFLKLTVNEVVINFSILFTSKSSIEAEIQKLYLDLYVNGKNVGFVEENRAFIIPAKGSSIIPIKISINPQSIFKNVVDVLLGAVSQKDVILSMDGFASIKSGFVKTTLPLKYETSIKKKLAEIKK